MDKAALNNQVILMRKSLKSVLNQTKLNLLKNINKLKKDEKEKQKKSVHRKESELEALKRFNLADVKLHDAFNAESLNKVLTRPSSSEMERATARILLNPLIQKKVTLWKQHFGPEILENFLKSNDENICNNKIKSAKKAMQKQKKEKRKAEKKDAESENDDEDAVSEAESNAGDDDNSDDDKNNDNSDVDEIKPPKPKKAKKSDSKPPKKPTVSIKKPPPPPKQPRLMVKTSDPFFVDSTGSNYLASIEKPDSDAEEYDSQRPPRQAFTREKKSEFKKTFNKKPIRPRWNDETPPRPAAKFNRRNDDRPAPAALKPSVTADADIHPSWKAKAEQRKQAMVEFQGTKIKFDD